MKSNALTKDERSLLLFLETCAVDHAGRVDTSHMNANDMEIAARWNRSGFLKFGRILSSDLSKFGTHWCVLTEQSWLAAHGERLARATRMWKNRDWKTTGEAMSEVVWRPGETSKNVDSRPMKKYALVEVLNSELIGLHGGKGKQLWAKTNLRKRATCAVTGKEVGDKTAWRPLTNAGNRSERISECGMRMLMSNAVSLDG
mgnify:CR=1 FL=1